MKIVSFQIIFLILILSTHMQDFLLVEHKNFKEELGTSVT